MAEVRSLLGAILRDIAEARVTSDLFSRDVGLEYVEDEILRDFPVPRVDMKEAAVRVRFAVESLEVREPDPDKTIKRLATERAEPLAKEIFRLVVDEHPKRDELVALIRRKQIDLPGQVARALASTLSELELVRAALDEDPTALDKALREQLRATLTEDGDVKKLLVPSRSDRRLATALQKASEVVITDLVERVRAEITGDKRRDLKLKLAVTRRELAEVPETIVSEISVVAEMRNYLWSETEEPDGSIRRRLLPE